MGQVGSHTNRSQDLFLQLSASSSHILPCSTRRTSGEPSTHHHQDRSPSCEPQEIALQDAGGSTSTVSPEATPEGHHFLAPRGSSRSFEAPATSPLLLPEVFPPFPWWTRGPEQHAPASPGLRLCSDAVGRTRPRQLLRRGQRCPGTDGQRWCPSAGWHPHLPDILHLQPGIVALAPLLPPLSGVTLLHTQLSRPAWHQP